jgi:hypothetical protein
LKNAARLSWRKRVFRLKIHHKHRPTVRKPKTMTLTPWRPCSANRTDQVLPRCEVPSTLYTAVPVTRHRALTQQLIEDERRMAELLVAGIGAQHFLVGSRC